jgi:RimJ/RimL family protein N-acetyltransferase
MPTDGPPDPALGLGVDLLQVLTTDTQGPYLSHGVLSDGMKVATRLLVTSDQPAVQAGFAHLGDQSRYTRFLLTKAQLTAGDLDLLMGDLSQEHQVAVALVAPQTGSGDLLIGVAHAMRLPAHPDTADVAITTGDEIHGQGGGRMLMRALADRSLLAGITRFSADMLTTNRAAFRVLAGVGDVETQQISQGRTELTVVLRPGP